MTLFYTVLFVILILIAIIDYSISEIPNALNIGLGILGIIFYIMNIKSNWWLPLLLSLGSFVLLFIFFLITGEVAIGGGDMKMIMASMLFINSFMELYYYLLWFCLFALIGVVITYIKKHKGVRCGPYLGLALFFTLVGEKMSINQVALISTTFIVTMIVLSYPYLIIKGELLFDEKNYSLF